MQARGFAFGGQAAAHMRGRDAVRLASLFMAGILILLSALPGPAEAARKKTTSSSNTSSTKVYRWVDDNGVVHYSDQIPPEQAPADRQILNQYGVPIKAEQGAMSQAEIEAAKRASDEREAARAAAERDAVLLSTYLSVDEIEALRNRLRELKGGG